MTNESRVVQDALFRAGMQQLRIERDVRSRAAFDAAWRVTALFRRGDDQSPAPQLERTAA